MLIRKCRESNTFMDTYTILYCKINISLRSLLQTESCSQRQSRTQAFRKGGGGGCGSHRHAGEQNIFLIQASAECSGIHGPNPSMETVNRQAQKFNSEKNHPAKK